MAACHQETSLRNNKNVLCDPHHTKHATSISLSPSFEAPLLIRYYGSTTPTHEQSMRSATPASTHLSGGALVFKPAVNTKVGPRSCVMYTGQA